MCPSLKHWGHPPRRPDQDLTPLTYPGGRDVLVCVFVIGPELSSRWMKHLVDPDVLQLGV